MPGGRSSSSAASYSRPANAPGSARESTHTSTALYPCRTQSAASARVSRSQSGNSPRMPIRASIRSRYARMSARNRSPNTTASRSATRVRAAVSVASICRSYASNEEYERQMEATLTAARTRVADLDAVVFGDLFLADIRAYRERMLARIGMRGLFPLWLRDTRALAADCVRQGYKAVLVCVDSRALPGAFAGREYDAALLDDLPPGIDPCGEHGEFHTFVYAGPILHGSVPHRRGEVVVRNGRFVYCDLLEITP